RLQYTLFFYCYSVHHVLHSFPTRRSSDLPHDGEDHEGAEHEGEDDAVPGPHREDEGAPRERLLRHGADRRRTPDRPHGEAPLPEDRKSTRLNSSHVKISYAVFCLKKKILK